MMMLELLAVHVQPVLKSMAREAQTTMTCANKHDFTKVERFVLPRCCNSFHEKLPVTDPTTCPIKGEGSAKMQKDTYRHITHRQGGLQRQKPRCTSPRRPRLS
jgi:hypothetical protein